MADEPVSSGLADETPKPEHLLEEIKRLQSDFQSRLIVANLRTEAVRAGMIDLDGLKLIGLSGVQLDSDDKVIGAVKIMEDLRRNKPWLFGTVTSSSIAAVPASQPVRQKSALEMTNEEYAAARTAITRRRTHNSNKH